jgi:hypothetical protein
MATTYFTQRRRPTNASLKTKPVLMICSERNSVIVEHMTAQSEIHQRSCDECEEEQDTDWFCDNCHKSFTTDDVSFGTDEHLCRKCFVEHALEMMEQDPMAYPDGYGDSNMTITNPYLPGKINAKKEG